MNSRSFTLVLLIGFLLLLACSKPEAEEAQPAPNPPSSNEPNPTEPIVPTGDENYLNLDSDYLFDQEKLPTFELQLSAENLAKLDADPAAEEYVEGSITFEGETISPVGIRYKGSIGAFVGCLSNPDWSNPSGYKTCTKLSMKIKFNWDGADTKFYGLKKLQLHSQNLDPSQMHDRLGYWLFRQMGVPAPRCVHARVVLNGKFIGLFALVEQIDGRFTRYHFDDGKGNLYKEIWPLTDQGLVHSEAEYIRNLETNEEDNPSAEIIRSFAQSFLAAAEEERPAVLDQRMDMDEILSYVAVDRLIRHDDGPFHWYCEGSSCWNHNYFWYETPGDRKVHLIPWDLDNAFQNIIRDENIVTAIADDWGDTRNNCLPFNYGPWGLRQWSAACDPLTAVWASDHYNDRYENIKQACIDGPLAKSTVEALLDDWTMQVRASTQEADQLYEDALPVFEWDNALHELKQQLDFARTQ